MMAVLLSSYPVCVRVDFDVDVGQRMIRVVQAKALPSDFVTGPG
jgi:hypothetical protein